MKKLGTTTKRILTVDVQKVRQLTQEQLGDVNGGVSQTCILTTSCARTWGGCA